MRQIGKYHILLLTMIITGCAGFFTSETLKRAQERGAPIFISSISLEPRLVSPVELLWYNLGPKTIYRVGFSISIYNKKGRKLLEKQLILSGNYVPMDKKEGARYNRVWWLGDWFRSSMVCVVIDKIDIVFTDDSKVVLDSREQLNPLLDIDVVQECKSSQN